MAPQHRLVLAKLFGLRSKASIVERQLTPLSSDRQTPPFAVATYNLAPPGATAIPATRPLIAARFCVWPRAMIDGPSGVQLFCPGIAGIPGAMMISPAAAARAPGVALTLRFLYS